MAHVIAFSFDKGGVGKTTTTITLASALERKGFKVLLIDLDPQATATKHFGLPAEFPRKKGEGGSQTFPPHMGQVLLGNVDIDKIRRRNFNIDILPAAHEMTSDEYALAPKPFSHTLLNEYLEPLLNEYDFILIDCPPSLGTYTTNALCAADSLIIPIEAASYSIESVEKMYRSFQKIKVYNPSLELLGIVITKCSYALQTTMGKNNLESLRKAFPDKVLQPYIRNSIAIDESQNNKDTIYGYDPHCKAARDYLAIAQHIIKTVYPQRYVEETTAQA
jgi:chromosome partitioning protein